MEAEGRGGKKPWAYGLCMEAKPDLGKIDKSGRGYILLGSNDPNTIPDPTRIRCSRSRMCSMFPLGLRCVLDLATFYVSSDSVLSGYVLL